MTWNTTQTSNGSHQLSAVARSSTGAQTTAPAITVTVNNSGVINTNPTVFWVDDALPAGAIPGADGGDAWTWVNSNPTPFSGTVASQSSIGAGLHQHYFDWASGTLAINPGDFVFAYVYLDPANPPSEVMLQWNDGTWEHRAYWGANNVDYGVDGTTSRFFAGPLPAAGQWARLEVRASQVGLEGSTLKGLAFAVSDGRATWDAAGKSTQSGGGNAGDTTRPTVAITAPANNASLSGSSTTVSATASDNIGVAGVQFKLDGANLGAEDTAAPYSAILNPSLLSNGTHSLAAVARDAAGNRATSAVVTVLIGSVTQPPATNKDVVWFDDTLPSNAVPGADGGNQYAGGGGNPERFYLRNNIFRMTRYAFAPPANVSKSAERWDEDYDFFFTSDPARGINYGSNRLDLAAYRTASGQGGSANRADSSAGFRTEPTLTDPLNGNLALAPGSPQIDAGVIVPNIADRLGIDYHGNAPDLGAKEAP